MTERSSWQALVEWAGGFALLAFAVIGMASIGMFVFPFAVLALLLLDRRHPSGREVTTGALVGIGAMLLVIGFMHVGSTPCEVRETVVNGVHIYGSTAHLTRGQHSSCGGLDPTPWLAVGGACLAIGLLAQTVAQRRRRVTHV